MVNVIHCWHCLVQMCTRHVSCLNVWSPRMQCTMVETCALAVTQFLIWCVCVSVQASLWVQIRLWVRTMPYKVFSLKTYDIFNIWTTTVFCPFYYYLLLFYLRLSPPTIIMTSARKPRLATSSSSPRHPRNGYSSGGSNMAIMLAGTFEVYKMP